MRLYVTSFAALVVLILFQINCEAVLPGATSSAQKSSVSKRKPTPLKPRIDYAKFSHLSETHRAECKTCHTFPSANWKEARKGDDPFPDVTEFPQHQSCLGCHRAQFFARERPAPAICSNCHVAISPRNTARFPFPSLGESFLSTQRGREFESDFKVAFPHDKHIDVVGQLRSPDRRSMSSVFISASFSPARFPAPQGAEPKSCAVCHETYQPQGKSGDEYVSKPPPNLGEDTFWLKKGTFKTTPVTHAACSACHNDEAGIAPAPADCAACHKAVAKTQPLRDFDPKMANAMGIADWRSLRQWSRRSAGRFRHEFDSHKDLSCTECHKPALMNTLDERTLVSVKSCGGGGTGCHVEANTDGILNYEIEEKKKNPKFQCVKCHISVGINAVPADHIDAIKAATK